MAERGPNRSARGTRRRRGSLNPDADTFWPSEPPVIMPPPGDFQPALPAPLPGLHPPPLLHPPSLDVALGPQMGGPGPFDPPGPPGLGLPVPPGLPQPIPPTYPLPPGIAPIVLNPESVASDDEYTIVPNLELPPLGKADTSEPMAHSINATVPEFDQWERDVLREASTWNPVRPEPFRGVPHKALPDFKDPRWNTIPNHSYVPYWTSPYWDFRKEEDWRGQRREEYMERAKLEGREHELRPALMRHALDDSVNQSDYAL